MKIASRQLVKQAAFGEVSVPVLRLKLFKVVEIHLGVCQKSSTCLPGLVVWQLGIQVLKIKKIMGSGLKGANATGSVGGDGWFGQRTSKCLLRSP